MRILFMGTPDIAAESLAALLDAGHEVCGVFTRRDKPVGRKQILTAPPVKQLAVEHGLSVYQPRTLRDGSSARAHSRACTRRHHRRGLRLHHPAAAAACGEVRLHQPARLAAAQIPRLRAIQWAVLNGDEGTGVTIMQLDEGVTPATS